MYLLFSAVIIRYEIKSAETFFIPLLIIYFLFKASINRVAWCYY